MDKQALVEYGYRAVRKVLGGSPIGEPVARDAPPASRCTRGGAASNSRAWLP